MTPAVLAFLFVNAIALLVLPRRYAALALLVGTCFMTRGQAIDLGPLTFTLLRILVAVGLVRIVIRREWIGGGINGLDGLMLVWGVWMIASVAFHEDPSNQVILRLRHVFDGWGLYFMFRTFIRSRDEMMSVAGQLGLVLLPIAAAMVLEKITGQNMFSALGGVGALSNVRDGLTRAQGPFAHAVLAGTIGAVSLPIMVGLWPLRRRLAKLGICACVAMVFASGSSGPILSMLAGIGAMFLWRFRHNMRAVRWAALGVYLGLELVMNRPAYFLATSMDLTGSSTGWHRSRLIQSAFQHLSEWWFAGTDFTRHWMPTGVSWSRDHTDITNHYIAQGVLGGLPLMLLFIAILVRAFWFVGEFMHREGTDREKLIVWANGAALFAHAATSMSVSYFDHSIVFLYMAIALTCAGRPGAVAQGVAAATPTPPVWKRPTTTWQPARTISSRGLNSPRGLARQGAHARPQSG